MRASALIMAGGRGERMRSTYGEVPKPLVPVRGVPLLERNLLLLFGAGFRKVAVSVSRGAARLIGFVEGRGSDLARAFGARLSVLVEERPLGTIGSAAKLRGEGDPLVVGYADNLSGLDLGAFVAHHLAAGASLTVATHYHDLRNTFGEVVVEGDRLTAYLEKPTHRTHISSGYYVLSPRALDLLSGERTDLPELVNQLLARGELVGSFHHQAPWIDVNDAAAVVRAEALIAAHPDQLECWASAPALEVAGVLIRGPRGILLERRPAGVRLYPDQWDTPGGKLEAGEPARAAARRELREELGLDVGGLNPVMVCDDLDLASGRVVRHHVFAAHLDGVEPTPCEGQLLRWWSPKDEPPPRPLNPIVTRSLAAERGRG